MVGRRPSGRRGPRTRAGGDHRPGLAARRGRVVGLATGSVLVAPVRTEAGLWATLEVWSDFREAFNPQDVKLIEKICSALAKKTPTT